MPRRAALVLDAATVATLIKKAEGQPREHADGSCPGLTLRVSPNACAWYARAKYRSRQYRVRLGDARTWTLSEARAVCIDVRRHVALGANEPAREWVEAKRAEHARTAKLRRGGGRLFDPHPVSEVPEVMPRARAQPRPTWTYRQALDAWTAWLESEAAAGALRPATVLNYRTVMGGPALRELDGRRVSEITDGTIARIVADLAAAGKRSTARDVVRVGKRFWRWMGDASRLGDSGVDRKRLDDLVAPKLGTHKLKGRRRFPAIGEVSHILEVAQSGALADEIGLGVELLCYTAQRRMSIIKARVAEFEPWTERPGWGVWYQAHRKIDRGSPTADNPRHGAHALPLPPPVWDRVQAYLARSEEAAREAGVGRSEWLLPAARPRRAGDPPPLHLSPYTLTHVVAAMPSVTVSPHDVRRAFATILQAHHGISSVQVGLVLDHANSDVLQILDTSATTRRYTGDEMLGLKAPALEAWVTALAAAKAAAWSALPPVAVLKAEIAENNRKQRGAGKRGGRRKAAAEEAA